MRKSLVRPAFSVVALAWLLASPAANAQNDALVSGDYSGLILAVDPATHIVTGYFDEETGEGRFSCIFYLTGKLEGAKAAITTWFPETPKDDLIKGELKAETARKVLVRLVDEHGGCWNVEHFADKDQPAEFGLAKAYPWTSVTVVKSAKAYFYDAPGAATHRKGYVVKGDGVGVRAVRNGWLQVDYVGHGKQASGWIRDADVFAFGAP